MAVMTTRKCCESVAFERWDLEGMKSDLAICILATRGHQILQTKFILLPLCYQNSCLADALSSHCSFLLVNINIGAFGGTSR